MNLIAGNWKMNKTSAEAKQFVKELKPLVEGTDEEVLLCVPFTCLAALSSTDRGNIKIGAQNIAWADKGAFTGEISGDMLKEFGVEYVIIGHSERRQMFGETDETVNMRIRAALQHEIRPIVCVGESLEIRREEKTAQFIEAQIKNAFKGLDIQSMQRVTVAYEPIWAIGTGLTATPAQAEETAANIHNVIASLYDESTVEKVRILYGGSMNPGNAAELLAQKNISGGLIGGASLKPADFAAIVNHAKN